MANAYFDEIMDLWLKKYEWPIRLYFSGDRGKLNPPVWKNLKEIIFDILDSPDLFEFKASNLLKILPVVNFDRFIFRLLEYCKPLHDDYLKKVEKESIPYLNNSNTGLKFNSSFEVKNER